MSFLNKLTFHNAKKLVSATTAPTDHPTEAADPSFETAVTEFNSYHDSLTAIDRAMSEYAKHMFDLYTSSFTIIDSMSHAISNNDVATLRNTFANTRQSHSILTGDREATISADLRANCIKPLQDELANHAKLQQAIQQRHETARELDYYSGKMDSLLTDKAKTEAKGKAVDMDKLERNQTKKDGAASLYLTLNSEVITQLHATTARKGDLLMRVFNSFEHIERQVAETYLAAVSSNGGGVGGGMSGAAAIEHMVQRSSISSSSSGSSGSGSGSSGVSIGEFQSRMGNMSKYQSNGASSDGDDGGVAISLGMEGQQEGQSDTLAARRSSFRSTTPPPPAYSTNANLPAPVATAARSRPGSPQPHPPPPPPPPPAKHL